jgi:hypothetical protein
LSMYVLSIWHLQQRSHSFWAWNTINLCSFHYLLSKLYFQHFKSFLSFLPQLKQNLMLTLCSLESAIFLVHKNHKWNDTHLCLTRHFLALVSYVDRYGKYIITPRFDLLRFVDTWFKMITKFITDIFSQNLSR